MDDRRLIDMTESELRALIRDELEARPEPPPQKKFMSTREVADHFGVQQQTVHAWIKRGCPARRIGGHIYRLDPEAVAAWRSGEPVEQQAS